MSSDDKDCTNNEQVKEKVQKDSSFEFTQKVVPSKIGKFSGHLPHF